MMAHRRSMKQFPSIKNFLPRLALTLALGAGLLAASPSFAHTPNPSVSAASDKLYDGLLAPQDRSAQPRKARMQTADGPQSSRSKHLDGPKEKARNVEPEIRAAEYAPQTSWPDRLARLSSDARSWCWLSRAPPSAHS
jgi:hypothetical protein